MGLSKWLLKNGPGSIGSTAKIWAKSYLNAKSMLSTNAAKLQTILYFTNSMQTIHTYNATEPYLLLYKSEFCLALLMWELNMEIPSNFMSIYNSLGRKQIGIMLESMEAVYEKVKEVAPAEVMFKEDVYKMRCQEYLTYRINKLQITSTLKPNYKTIYRVVFNAILYCDYEDFDNVKDAYDSYFDFMKKINCHSIEIVFIAELNDDRYIFIHICNKRDYQSRQNEIFNKTKGDCKIDGIN